MSEKSILGHINCPYCGTANGMRITSDKNGAPFGFCEASCDGQLRVGGKARRVDAFLKQYPHIAQAMQPKQEKPPVTVTATPVPENKPAPIPETKPAQKKAGFSLEF
ncbi:hypothetical protein [Methylobacillus flagellatus]|uniref:Uncharacterized protein n=3 Tax=root TaxID=1 RepID=Q1H2P5_METFK|nr:hypothetical protein [Methylobacillus flagellatus]ABE49098.1 hypothetical protein Mfla_0830 [Methylobacillus flagellatus KT]ABE49242.1 hypothetical protein Mfla_0974 [Methylobacillus flagellatus KT]ABZ07586.1 hypothetical protein ALOHA_HF4000ANIW137K11ctg2g5 [uncultured marine microorganism HF4000_ANIW137K11]